MKNKIGALFLACALLLPFGAAAAVGSYENFTDLEANGWYREAVEFMLDKGYMDGMSDTQFGPGLYLTRAQAVTILWRSEGAGEFQGGALPFADVKADTWYSDAVKWAYYSDLTDGVSETEFGTEQNVSRQQLAVWLYRLSSATPEREDHLSSFADAGDISEYAKPAMNWAVAKGIIDGADGSLLPQSPATRAQAAVMIHRYMKVSTAVPVPAPPVEER